MKYFVRLILYQLISKVADEKFCETTIGSKDAEAGADLKLLFQTDNFR